MVRVGGNLNPTQQKETLTENQHFRLDNGLEDTAKTTQAQGQLCECPRTSLETPEYVTNTAFSLG